MHEISTCEICGQTLCTTFWLELHMSASHESKKNGCYYYQNWWVDKFRQDYLWKLHLFQTKLSNNDFKVKLSPGNSRCQAFILEKNLMPVTFVANNVLQCVCLQRIAFGRSQLFLCTACKSKLHWSNTLITWFRRFWWQIRLKKHTRQWNFLTILL